MIDLSSLTVLVTRPAAIDYSTDANGAREDSDSRIKDTSSDPLSRLLLDRGARVLQHPVIETRSIESSSGRAEIEATLANLDHFDTVVLASRTGVDFLRKELKLAAIPLSRLSQKRMVAIGNGTAQLISSRFEIPAERPSNSNSESLADWLIERHQNGKTSRILVLRANRGSRVLAESLQQAGIPFTELVIYQSLDITQLAPDIEAEFNHGRVDWITVTSSSIANASIKLFRPWLMPSSNAASTSASTSSQSGIGRRCLVASISPTTSRAVNELGFQVDAEANEYNFEGLVRAIENRVGGH